MIRVTCAIIESDTGVLCAQRSATMAHPGKWEFPGGKIETGETDEDCLIREIREELDVSIEILHSLEGQPFTYPDGFCLYLVPFRCRILNGQPRPLQHQKLMWVSRDRLRELDWAGADVPVLESYLKIYP